MDPYYTLITYKNFNHHQLLVIFIFVSAWPFEPFGKVCFNLIKLFILFLSLFLLFLPEKIGRLFTCQGNVRLNPFSICAKLHIFAYNKWTTRCKLDEVHIFETQSIVDRVAQSKIFIFLCTIIWGFNFVLLI